MRRLGLALLAPASVLLVACGTRTTMENGEEPLNEDLVLAADLPADLASAQYTELLASIRSCRAERSVKRPSEHDSARSASLTQRAQESELLGDDARARSLLEEALTHDPANRTALYHLARWSEARRDTAAATRAYCRYLRLNPNDGDAAEARTRLLSLWRSPSPAGAQEVAMAKPVSATKAISALNGSASTSRVRRVTSPVVSKPVATVAGSSDEVHVDDGLHSTGSNGEVTDSVADGVQVSPRQPVAVATTPPARTDGSGGPSDDSPRETRQTSSGGATMGAIAGAAVGAIAGAAMGGKLKHVLIGTAAGAVIGAATGQATGGGSD